MMLIETTTIQDAALPVEAFKAHLRLGTGFGEDTVQDGVLKGFLRAALAAIEARTGKALLERSFSWTVNRWRKPERETLPLAPVSSLSELVLIDADGGETVQPIESYRLQQDGQSPVVRPVGACLPVIDQAGAARISFVAGMAATWAELPADLAQAVLLLAAHYYEYRNETALGDGCMPFGVTSLIQRYRPMRLGAFQ
jgi:uncharacterized phiE125 gp8 family phage protein